jgi:beta-1,4-mannosyltransferase
VSGRKSPRRELHRTTPVGSRTRVLLSLSAPDGTTRYVDQVVAHPPPGQTFLYFSWPRALLGRYDVFHVHWPEYLLRSRSGVLRLARVVLSLALLLRLRLTRVAVVRTIHNLEPHEPGSALERRVLAALDARVTLFVVLNTATPRPADRPVLHVPHGHYLDALPAPATTPVPGRVLFIGRLQPYKNVPGLIDAFAGLASEDATLRIAGLAGADVQRELRDQTAGHQRISLVFGFLPDVEMVAEVGAAQLVALPYRELHNSGIALVALSLGRPVLVPRTPATELLAEQVGRDWVHLFDGPLSSARLAEALERTSRAADRPPDLTGRGWRTVGEGYHRAYTQALDIVASRLR